MTAGPPGHRLAAYSVLVSHRRVLVVGAGFSGIAMGARLRRAGIDSFLILEKADDVGGTWRDNRYPGCACDVPSRLYSLSFAPKADWSCDFAPASEIWGYLRDCVARFGLGDRLVLGAQVQRLTWEHDRWRVQAADGREWTADAVVLGVGGLHVPSRPDLAGLSSFAGPVLHTAAWPGAAAGDGLDGLRVGVVGTGASAVQLVPELAKRVAELVVFQRTAGWLLPRHDRAWTPARQRLYARIPLVQRAVRLRTFLEHEARILAFGRWRRLRQATERAALAHLAAAVPDPVTRAALTPADELGCKRVMLSDDYWPTFALPHVHLVTASIEQVRPRGVRTTEGAEIELDALVLATGFDLRGSFDRIRVTGLAGRTLEDVWGRQRGSNLGITVAGFPELYLLLGPNTALGHTSVLLQIESAIDYILAALRVADERGPQVLTRRAQERFGRWVRRRTRHTVWGSGCQSWYLDERGRNVAIWPASTLRYRLRTRRVRAEDYEPAITPAAPAGSPRPPG